MWFLLGTYAERSGDLERALGEYGRAMTADPADYRPILCRGNVHFTEGDYGEAIRDYLEGGRRRTPRPPDVFLQSLPRRGEAYDFDGQGQAITAAQGPLGVAGGVVGEQPRRWPASCRRGTRSRGPASGSPRGTPSRKAAAFPGMAPPRRPGAPSPRRGCTRRSPFSASACSSRARAVAPSPPFAIAAARAFCNFLPSLRRPLRITATCARAPCARKAWTSRSRPRTAAAMQRRAKRRARASRLVSLFVPGSHAFLEGRPVAGGPDAVSLFLGVAMAWLDEKLSPPSRCRPRKRSASRS